MKQLKDHHPVIENLRRNYRSERAVAAQIKLLEAIERSQAALSTLLLRFYPHVEHAAKREKEQATSCTQGGTK